MRVDIFSENSNSYLINNHNNGLKENLNILLGTEKLSKVKFQCEPQLLDPLLNYYSKNKGFLPFDDILIQISKKNSFSKLANCFFDQHSYLTQNKVIEIVDKMEDKTKIAHFKSLTRTVLKFLQMEKNLFSLVNNFCNSITLLDTQNLIPYSGSSNACLGQIWISYVNKLPLIGEMLIHEAAHTKLFCFQEFKEVHNLSEIEFWEDNRYYSPWRKDRRPLGGLFHGLFVFFHILKWYSFLHYKSIFEEFRNSIILPRIMLIGLQIRSALFELQKINDSIFTDYGLDIIEKITRDTNYILSKFDHISFNSVLYFPLDKLPDEGIKLSDFVNNNYYESYQ